MPHSSGPRRRAVLIGAVALAILAAPVGAVGSSAAASMRSAAPRSQVPHCRASDLVVWLNTRGNGTAGGVYYELEVTNLSRHPCATGGYPGVSAVDLAGRQIGSAARRGGGTPASFKLAHGQSAVAALRIVDAGNFPPSSCSVTIAAGLRVYPPNDRSSKIVPFPFAACAKTADRVLQIGPLMRPSA